MSTFNKQADLRVIWYYVFNWICNIIIAPSSYFRFTCQTMMMITISVNNQMLVIPLIWNKWNNRCRENPREFFIFYDNANDLIINRLPCCLFLPFCSRSVYIFFIWCLHSPLLKYFLWEYKRTAGNVRLRPRRPDGTVTSVYTSSAHIKKIVWYGFTVIVLVKTVNRTLR